MKLKKENFASMICPTKAIVLLLDATLDQIAHVVEKVVLNAKKKGYSPHDIQVLGTDV